jgi:hypothetical protein
LIFKAPAWGKGDKDVKKDFKKTRGLILDFSEKFLLNKRT